MDMFGNWIKLPRTGSFDFDPIAQKAIAILPDSQNLNNKHMVNVSYWDKDTNVLWLKDFQNTSASGDPSNIVRNRDEIEDIYLLVRPFTF